MKSVMKLSLFLTLTCGVLFYFSASSLADTNLPKAKLPVLTTSAGQSPDVTTVNIICEEAGIKYDYCDVPTAEMIGTGVGLAGKESA
ncbi:MAG: DUF6305 family protein, partial [Candidatus Aminicenantaceae bacterium]